MGVRILEGTYDGDTERQRAVLIDSVSEAAFGHLFDSADQAERFLAWLPEVPEETPDVEVSAAAIAGELREIEEGHRMLEVARNLVADAVSDVEVEKQRVEEAQARLAKAEERLARDQANLDAQPTPPDPAPLRARLEAVDATNAAVRTKQERVRLAGELADLRAESEHYTAELARIDKEKADAIAAAKMPLDGLSFDEDGVIYQGIPFSQASSAERLRVGIAMAMALNPTIRVIRITDGSLLDSENLALIEQMAGEHDFQIWIEKVDETGKVGVTIEDGQVAGAEPVEELEEASA